ncbi:alginate lyase family protein [Pedobacter sp. R-06]|uniref:alginate lyase family protein n=1 Tax=Pedobacter sp. R-06 TaxID=3404051 RepID=UPI003CF7650A
MKKFFNIPRLLICLFLLIICENKLLSNTGKQTFIKPTLEANEITIIHPAMLHTKSDFEFIKSKLAHNLQPWKSGFDVLAASGFVSLNYVANPQIKIVRGGKTREEPDPDNYSNAYRDAAAAYQLGLMYNLTGNTKYADKAVEILNAWAITNKNITGNSNKFLASGIYGYQFANAAELVRGYSGWKAAEFKTFQNWMLNVWYPLALDFLQRHNGTCATHYWTNWDIANMTTILSIGILTDDKSKINYAVDYFKNGIGNGNIFKAVVYRHKVGDEDLGQGQESGRDQGHATLNISLYGAFCQMAYHIGIDLFAFDNNRVLALAEYTAKYNVNATNDVPFLTYKNCDPGIEHNVVSSGGRGNVRPCWELIFNHYAKIKGLKATYSQQFASKLKPEGGGGNYGPNSGGFDQLGFGTLMYSR